MYIYIYVCIYEYIYIYAYIDIYNSNDQPTSVSDYPRIKVLLKTLGYYANSNSHVLF